MSRTWPASYSHGGRNIFPASRHLTGAVTVMVRVNVAHSTYLCACTDNYYARRGLLFDDLETKDALERIFHGMGSCSVPFSKSYCGDLSFVMADNWFILVLAGRFKSTDT